jgi:hypothetical protein
MEAMGVFFMHLLPVGVRVGFLNLASLVKCVTGQRKTTIVRQCTARPGRDLTDTIDRILHTCKTPI